MHCLLSLYGFHTDASKYANTNLTMHRMRTAACAGSQRGRQVCGPPDRANAYLSIFRISSAIVPFGARAFQQHCALPCRPAHCDPRGAMVCTDDRPYKRQKLVADDAFSRGAAGSRWDTCALPSKSP